MGGVAQSGRRRLRRVLFAAIAFLYLMSVPWYRRAGAEPAVWLGLPDWVAVAVLCYVGVAILNAAAWSLTEVEDSAPTGPEPDARALEDA